MTDMTQDCPPRASLVDIARTASPFALLQQALRRQKPPPQMPRSLHADLDLPADDAPDHALTAARYY